MRLALFLWYCALPSHQTWYVDSSWGVLHCCMHCRSLQHIFLLQSLMLDFAFSYRSVFWFSVVSLVFCIAQSSNFICGFNLKSTIHCWMHCIYVCYYNLHFSLQWLWLHFAFNSISMVIGINTKYQVGAYACFTNIF